MDKRISKSFRVIFSSLYTNFNEEETKNSEKYFNFILANFPDRSEIRLLKIVFFIFSFGIRRVFIKDKNIPKFVQNLQSSNLSLLRKLGSGMTALFGLSTARSLDGESSVYKHLDYPIYGNTKIEKKDVSIPKSIEVAVIGSGSGGGVQSSAEEVITSLGGTGDLRCSLEGDNIVWKKENGEPVPSKSIQV